MGPELTRGPLLTLTELLQGGALASVFYMCIESSQHSNWKCPVLTILCVPSEVTS